MKREDLSIGKSYIFKYKEAPWRDDILNLQYIGKDVCVFEKKDGGDHVLTFTSDSLDFNIQPYVEPKKRKRIAICDYFCPDSGLIYQKRMMFQVRNDWKIVVGSARFIEVEE